MRVAGSEADWPPAVANPQKSSQTWRSAYCRAPTGSDRGSRGEAATALASVLFGAAGGLQIIAAMRRALEMMRETDLDTKLVSYGAPSRALLQMAEEFG